MSEKVKIQKSSNNLAVNTLNLPPSQPDIKTPNTSTMSKSTLKNLADYFLGTNGGRSKKSKSKKSKSKKSKSKKSKSKKSKSKKSKSKKSKSKK